jgi:hypothetical protein
LRLLYSGEWKDGLYHGTGTLYYQNGEVYEGEFKQNLRSGKGTMKYLNGDVYEGNWSKDMRSSRGILRLGANNMRALFFSFFWTERSLTPLFLCTHSKWKLV